MQKRIQPKSSAKNSKHLSKMDPEDVVKIRCPRGHAFKAIPRAGNLKYRCPHCLLQF